MTQNSESSSDSHAEPDDKQASAPSTETQDQGAKPESLLDAVKSVFEEGRGAKSPAAKEDTTVRNSDEANPDAATDDGTEKAPKDDRFDKHPRFQELVSERNQLRENVQDYERIQSFMKANSLSVDDVSMGFRIMAAFRNDPAGAFEMLQPHLEVLQQFTGDKLPDDLSDRVQNGYIDAQTAKELAQRRNMDQLRQSRGREQQERQTHEQEAQRMESQQRSQHDMGQAVAAWENGIKLRDADYPAKAKLIETQYRVLMQAAPPRTQQEAVAMAEQAYAEVNEQTRAFRAVKPAIRGPKSTNSSTSAKAAPTSLKEAIALAARR